VDLCGSSFSRVQHAGVDLDLNRLPGEVVDHIQRAEAPPARFEPSQQRKPVGFAIQQVGIE
jgi:hypothetical protein